MQKLWYSNGGGVIILGIILEIKGLYEIKEE